MNGVQRSPLLQLNSPLYVVPLDYAHIILLSLLLSQIADGDRKISTLYDMLDEQDATNRDAKGLPFTVCTSLPLMSHFVSLTNKFNQIRTVFVIDPKKVIRLTISYPASTGRNFDEILRYVFHSIFSVKFVAETMLLVQCH